jgi:hypothetical protein
MRGALVTIKRAVILVGAGLVLAAGLAYLFAFRSGKPPGVGGLPPTGTRASAAQLAFDSPTSVPAATPEEREPSFMPCEWQVAGHQDFWFRNESDDPVQIRLDQKSCTCAQIGVCVLPEGLRGLKPNELDVRAQDMHLDWHALEPGDSNGVTVTAHAAGGVRLGWMNKEQRSGPQALTAELVTESRQTTGEPIELRVEVAFFDPVMVGLEDNLKDVLEPPRDGELSVGTLLAGDARTVNLLCLSFTRTAFSVKPEPTDDPCVACAAPQKLAEEQCKKLSEQISIPILCAYRVPVTVRERTEDGKLLDLGRFRRHLKFTSDAAPQAVDAVIGGTVRGDITVGSGNERDLVLLGSFERSEGKTKEVSLTTERAALDLEVESKPEFLTVELREEKGLGLLGKTWTLAVTVPPDSLSGPVPPHSYIVLKTKGGKARRIFIPVTGNAYVR